MAFQVSPGVQINEIDATNVVPAVSTSIGGFVGSFNWGPVEQILTISSEQELVERFGTPDNNTYKYFFVAASFLKYGNALKVVRAASGHQNATSDGSGQLIKNEDDYENNYVDGSLSKGNWASKYPGSLGNSLKVEFVTQQVSSSNYSNWSHSGEFDSAPGTSDYASDLGATTANDEMHIVVVDEDGLISGTAGTVLEKFAFVSQASDAKKADGTSNFYKEVVNSSSQYVWWIDHDSDLTNAGSSISGGQTSFVGQTTVQSDSLSGAADDNTPTSGELQLGYDLFEDAETEDVNLLFAAPDANGENTIALDLISIANARKDCVAFVSPPIEDTVNSSSPAADVKAFVDGLTSTSYAACDSTALYVYDKYNDVYRWIGAAGHQAGLCANTDRVADSFFSPAGFNRGNIRGAIKLSFNPNQAQRDTLYRARVNPVVNFPGQGVVLFGDKTALDKPSAFDRINVRRLFLLMEKAIATAAKFQLFEFNDEFTRAQFRNLVEPFLRDLQGRRGISDFRVIADASNNTGEVIDRNEFVADIFVKPARSINFISLSFVATRTGVAFTEVGGA